MFHVVLLLSFTCKTWRIYMWDMTPSYVGHDSFIILTIRSTSLRYLCLFILHSLAKRGSFICGTWLIYTWDMTHFLFWQYVPRRCAACASFPRVERRVTWLTGMCGIFQIVSHDSFMYGTWLIHTWDMTDSLLWQYIQRRCAACARFPRFERRVTLLTDVCGISHSHVRHDSFMYGTWLIHTWDMTHSYVGHDSFIRGTWLIHTWDMTHSYVGHNAFIRGTWLIHTWATYSTSLRCVCPFPALWKVRGMTHWDFGNHSFPCGAWLIHIRDMTLLYVGHDSFITLTICSTLFRCLSFLPDFRSVWYDSLICVTWLIHIWDLALPYVGHTRLIHMWDITHLSFWQHAWLYSVAFSF